MNVAIMGFGTIGSGVEEVLRVNAAPIAERVGQPLLVKYILDVRDFSDTPFADRVVHDYQIIAQDPDVDIVVETMGGVEPAFTFVHAMLSAGKHVVTSNKALVADKGAELLALARSKGVAFLFEAAVGGGIPIIRPLLQCLTGDVIEEITGIVNGTTNFILSAMDADGAAYDDVLKDAQAKGFAERDPSADVDGWDASAKLTALMNVLMDETITPMDIDRIGISGITKEDLDKAVAGGKKIKLLCHGYLKDGKAIGEVKPTLVDKNDMAAIMDATMSYVTVNTDLMGEVTVVEHAFEPEIDHTAYGVLSDLLRILTNTR